MAIDSNFAPALFNLGLAYYRAGQFKEARTYLLQAAAHNQQQVEPGWFLALTQEEMGEQGAAVDILADLLPRFPADTDVAKELARLTGATLLEHPGFFLGDRSLRLQPGNQVLESVTSAGRVLWQTPLPAPAMGMNNADGGLLTLLIGKEVWFADLGTGKLLGHRAYQDKYMAKWLTPSLFAQGEDTWIQTPQGGGQYAFTMWTLYDVTTDKNGQFIFSSQPELLRGGQTLEASSDGHTLLLSDRNGAPYTLYRDGRPLHEFATGSDNLIRAALAPSGNAVWGVGRSDQVTLLRPTGEVRWETRVTGGWSITAWPGPDLRAVVAQSGAKATYSVVGEDGKVLFSGEGRVTDIDPSYLLLADAGGDTSAVVDRQGQVVLRLHSRWATFTPDHRWVYFQAPQGSYVLAYPVPR